MEHNFERLKEHILPISQSDDFYHAKKEWLLVVVSRFKCNTSDTEDIVLALSCKPLLVFGNREPF